MTQLEERLAELATRPGDPVAGAPVDDLWARGRRRVRRVRTAQSAAALCAVVALGAGGLAGTGALTPEAAPVSSSTPALLPDALERAMPDALPDLGPGEVVALGERMRETGRWFWSDWTYELVGVQASTGRYGVVETPGRVGLLEGAALSPDGAHLAYWGGEEDGGEARPVASRLVLLDLVDGSVTEHELDAEFGVAADSSTLVWLDDESLLVEPTRFDDAEHSSGGSRPEDRFVLDVAGTTRAVSDHVPWRPMTNAVAGRYVADRDTSEDLESPDPAVVDPVEGTSRGVTLPQDPQAAAGRQVVDLQWDGARTLAGLADPTPAVSGEGVPNRVVFGELGDEQASTSPGTWRDSVDVTDWSELLGWRDGGVVVDTFEELALVREGEEEAERLVSTPLDPERRSGRGGYVERWYFAQGLLADAEVAPGQEPSADVLRGVWRNADLLLGALVLLGGAGAAVRLVRRRRGHA